MPRNLSNRYLSVSTKSTRMKRLFQPTWILPVILGSACFCLADLDVAYEWKSIDYTWQSYSQKLRAIEAGEYNKTKIIPNDVQPLPDGRILVTTPRYFNNPASLSTISSKTGDGGSLLSPYPSWDWHNRRNCRGITSVNRVILDDCNRLWLVDSGKIGNNQLYISDLEGYGLLIWNGSKIWRRNDDVFSPDPNKTVFSIAGENMTLSLGLSGALITPREYFNHPALIYKPLSATKGYGISTDDLHNSDSGSLITVYQTNFTAPSQELARALSKTGGILIAGFATETLLGCWNLRDPLEEAYIGYLVTNETTLQFVSGVKITAFSDSTDQTLVVLSNRLQKFVRGTMNFDEINFRIMTADVDTLINGTVCVPTSSNTVADGIQDKQFLFYEES